MIEQDIKYIHHAVDHHEIVNTDSSQAETNEEENNAKEKSIKSKPHLVHMSEKRGVMELISTGLNNLFRHVKRFFNY